MTLKEQSRWISIRHLKLKYTLVNLYRKSITNTIWQNRARPNKCDGWKWSKGICLVKALAIQVRSNEPQAIHLLYATFFLLTTSFQLIRPPFFSSCLAALSLQYVPRTPPDILSPWGNPASTTHTTLPLSSSWNPCKSNLKRLSAEHTYVQLHTQLFQGQRLPSFRSTSATRDWQNWKGLSGWLNSEGVIVEGVWFIFDRQLGFSSILSPTHAPRSYLTRSDVMSQQGAIFINLQLRYDLNVPALQLVDCDWLMKSEAPHPHPPSSRAQVIHSDSFPPPPRSLRIILRQALLTRTFSGRFVVTTWGKCKRSHHSVAATC